MAPWLPSAGCELLPQALPLLFHGLHSSQTSGTIIWVSVNVNSLRTNSEAQGQGLEGEFPTRMGRWALAAVSP